MCPLGYLPSSDRHTMPKQCPVKVILYRHTERLDYTQPNFNGSNTFGTTKTRPRQGQPEPTSANHSTRSGGHKREIFRLFFNMEIYCVFSLESPHGGDSNANINLPFSILKKTITRTIPNLQPGDYFRGLKNEYETAVINEPSVFDPLKFYCIREITQVLLNVVNVSQRSPANTPKYWGR